MQSQLFLKTVIAAMTMAIATGISAQPFYCPGTTTDTDGDGWGWENNTSCIVLQANSDTPVCSSAAIDSDGDGWGWESGKSCLIDNVVKTITTDDGEIIASPSNNPLIRHFNSDEFYTLRAVDSNGTRYEFSHITNTLAFRDSENNVVWRTTVPNDNSVDSMHLGKNERFLYLHMSAGEIASYHVTGGLNWQTDSFELVGNFALTDVSIIFSRSGWGDGYGNPDLDNHTVVSLSYDGEVNWEFRSDYLFDLAVGRDQNVYISVSGDSGNFDKVYVLKPE